MPATKQVTRPPVCSQISGAVVSWWARGVRGVAVLVGEPPAGRLLRDPRRQVDDVARVVAGQSAGRQHHLGAVGAQRGDLLGGRGVGDDDERAVAEEPADQREADPGVARGALDDHPTRAQRPGALGGADHPQRRPVLDAPAGVLPLGLDVDRRGQALGHPPQADERGGADGVEHRFVDAPGHAPCVHAKMAP
jgi:hypothetical protein